MTTAVTLVVGVTGWWNGWFDVQRGRLELQRAEIRSDIQQLQGGRSELGKQISTLTAERQELSKRIQGLQNGLDAVAERARSFAERAAMSESARRGCVTEVQRWSADYRRIAAAAASLIPNDLRLPIRAVDVHAKADGGPLRYTVGAVPDHSANELLAYLQVRIPGLRSSTAYRSPLVGTILAGEGAVDIYLEPTPSQDRGLRAALSDLGLILQETRK
jgi:hypothetical protein